MKLSPVLAEVALGGLLYGFMRRYAGRGRALALGAAYLFNPLYAALTATALANLALHDPPLREWLGDGFDATAHWLGLLNAAAACALFGWWAALLVRVERFPAIPRLWGEGSRASATREAQGGV